MFFIWSSPKYTQSHTPPPASSSSPPPPPNTKASNSSKAAGHHVRVIPSVLKIKHMVPNWFFDLSNTYSIGKKMGPNSSYGSCLTRFSMNIALNLFAIYLCSSISELTLQMCFFPLNTFSFLLSLYVFLSVLFLSIILLLYQPGHSEVTLNNRDVFSFSEKDKSHTSLMSTLSYHQSLGSGFLLILLSPLSGGFPS